MTAFSRRYKFSDWPNAEVPSVTAGVYVVWDGQALLYCGMSGRAFEKASTTARVKIGLVTRLASHASGRLSGDQFCVYIANRLVIPTLTHEQLARFATGELTLVALHSTVVKLTCNENGVQTYASWHASTHSQEDYHGPHSHILPQ